LILGGPPECPERPFCQIGLRDTYGLEFAEFRPLDVGGPLTVAALENGDIDVGLLLTSDPNITSCFRTICSSSWPTTSSPSCAMTR
jgi:osmoprotectant transport system substrate-binding protein